MKKNALFAVLWVLFGLLSGACDRRSEPEVTPCGYCPNNTVCIDETCGCPPERVDMGSWCIQKQDNLFVAKDMLGCPCFEPFGVVLSRLVPESPGAVISSSTFGIYSRENTNVGLSSNFSYYKLPEGDSIDIWGFPMPKALYPGTCRISADQTCTARLSGRFVSPDSIRAGIHWFICSDPEKTPEPYHFWLVRQR